MALTKCEECGGKISKKAQSCPHCGHISRTMIEERSREQRIEQDDREMRKDKDRLIFWGLLFIVSLVVFWF